MPQILRNKFYYLIALLFALVTTNAWPNPSSNIACEKEDFKSVYYFIDVEAIASVSDYFKQIPNVFFEKSDELFIITIGQKKRVETYFDDNNLNLLKHNKELLITVDKNLPMYRAGRAQILFKDNNVEPNNVSTFEVKNYNKKATPLDKHVLFGRTIRKQRQLLLETIKKTTISPAEEIAAKIMVEHQEIVQLYRHFGLSYGAITLDNINISNYGLPNTYSLLKFELYADRINQLKEHEREYLIKLFCNVNTGFKKRFPQIAPSLRFGYVKFHKLSERQLPNRALFKKYPLLFKVGQIVVLIFIGFLFIYLLLGRYTKRQNCRIVMTKRHNDSDDG